ncbi:MAG: hypothetical protein MUF04_08920 [Akkermansiaceae bacterium]|jgi:hypothetical protein|nr:hypothetical protein [Akkermansiaceae bacterium]
MTGAPARQSRSATRSEGLRISSRFNTPVRNRNDDPDSGAGHGPPGPDYPDAEDEEVVRLSEPYAQTAFRTIPRQEPDPDANAGWSAGGHRNRKLHAEWGLRKQHRIHWFIAGGAGVVALLILTFVIQQRWLSAPPEPMPQVIEVETEDPVPEVEGFEISGTSQREARDLLTRFAHARTAEDALPLMRGGARLAALVRANWRPWNAPTGWTTPLDASWATDDDSGRGFGLLTGVLPDFTPFRAYFIRENGAIKLDWEATTGFSATDFSRLVRGAGTGGVTRAYVEPDSYYSLVFPEESYRCFKLLSPDMATVVWGYAALNSQTENAIRHYFPSGLVQDPDDSVRPMTLVLEPAPDGAQPFQWRIVRMLHHEWVAP